MYSAGTVDWLLFHCDPKNLTFGWVKLHHPIHVFSHSWRASRSLCSLLASAGDEIWIYRTVSSANSRVVEVETEFGRSFY